MRGEETQVVGILEKFQPTGSCNVITLGSHSKVIHVSSDYSIQKSMTTMSGQLFDCIVNHTIVGKSVAMDQEIPENLDIDVLIELAQGISDTHGLTRSLLLPRFMESFTTLSGPERRIYLEAVIAYEDCKAIRDFCKGGTYETKQDFIIGQRIRSIVLSKMLHKMAPDVSIDILDGKEKNRDISILGIMKLIEKENRCKEMKQ